ncbi:ankyrin repeat domain-containing protein [Legionella worsleiensis]|uniref:Ankyrin repeat protein n=1 Tax=Legionella worsleiensis TaxID=45076 RepID=A0A0W1A9M5_9GAMM|nr:ankyrin repeat domain-containing protein [Legionella worsleiensis]KTD77995.1 Ankyrin repeat protein [Legionella worsleiensis]STY31525.1 Ankyrin repeat protein [Legionella worsleiensis]
MNFDTLCEQLGINATHSPEHKLELLKRWFMTHVSTDVVISNDSIDTCYSQYAEFLGYYLDRFAPYIPQDVTKPVPEFDGKTTLEAAAYYGFDKLLATLAPAVSEINKPNSSGLTPLHIAALAGNLHTIEVLLDLGADLAQKNHQLQMAVFCALQLPALYEERLKENKIKIYQLLKQQGLETLVNQDSNGDTIMHQMAMHNYFSLMADLLNSHHQLAFIQNNQSHYPIHTAILNNALACAHILFNDKEVAHVADSKGRVALHYAARYSGADMVTLCSNASVNKDPLDSEGKTPFMLAAEVANFEAMKMLLDLGANAACTDYQGQTALHLAVCQGEKAVALWLLEHTNIDVNALDTHQQSALAISQRAGTDNLSELLIGHGAI